MPVISNRRESLESRFFPLRSPKLYFRAADNPDKRRLAAPEQAKAFAK
jgi:hypothetical protein